MSKKITEAFTWNES